MINVKEEITKILDAFAAQEIGNRLSEFALLSLRSLLLKTINDAEKSQTTVDTVMTEE